MSTLDQMAAGNGRPPTAAQEKIAAGMATFPTTVIRPASPWELFGLGELWRYRELVAFMIWRDVKVRYKQTLLGAAWAIIQPVMLTVVFIFLTTRVAKVSDTGGFPPALFFFSGTCLWTFFTSSVANAGNSVVGSEKMITKIYFPRLSIPLAAVGAAVVDFVISFALLLAVCAWYHVMPGRMMLLMPAVFVTVLMLALGVGSLLAALNVSYRDFRYVIPFMIQIWMFATPTIYSTWTSESTGWKHLVQALNPMTPLVATFRAVCLGGTIDWPTVGAAVGMSVAALVFGCAWFRRTEHTFADKI